MIVIALFELRNLSKDVIDELNQLFKSSDIK